MPRRNVAIGRRDLAADMDRIIPLIGNTSFNVQNVIKPVYHVDDYGAVGDGSTDDSTAIQDAIDAMTDPLQGPSDTFRRDTLSFGPRQYNFATTLSITKQINIEGNGARLHYTGSAEAIDADAGDPDYLNDFAWRNFTLTGTSSATMGLRLTKCLRALFDNVHVKNFTNTSDGYGAYLEATTSCRFLNCSILANYINIAFDDNASSVPANENMFYGCTFNDCTSTSATRGSVYAVGGNSAGVANGNGFIGCWIEDNDTFGVYAVDAAQWYFIDCRLEGNAVANLKVIKNSIAAAVATGWFIQSRFSGITGTADAHVHLGTDVKFCTITGSYFDLSGSLTAITDNGQSNQYILNNYAGTGEQIQARLGTILAERLTVGDGDTSGTNHGGDEWTIASGAITWDRSNSWLVVDTESAAATDDLDTINGGEAGDIIFIHTKNLARDVTLKHNTGNLIIGADFTLTDVRDLAVLFNDGFNRWLALGLNNNI